MNWGACWEEICDLRPTRGGLVMDKESVTPAAAQERSRQKQLIDARQFPLPSAALKKNWDLYLVRLTHTG